MEDLLRKIVTCREHFRKHYGRPEIIILPDEAVKEIAQYSERADAVYCKGLRLGCYEELPQKIRQIAKIRATAVKQPLVLIKRKFWGLSSEVSVYELDASLSELSRALI